MTPESPPGPARGRGETRAIVRRLIVEGRTVREVAALAGISTQAANYHIRKLRADGDLPELDVAS